MKKIILSALFIGSITIFSFAQSASELPATTAVSRYKLSVGYSTTTVLIFPSAIQQADRGTGGIIIQKQPTVENVLKIKASRKDFQPTNIHVFTANGRLYAFDVMYAAHPEQTTYDLTMLNFHDSLGNSSKPQIGFFPKIFDLKQIANNVAKVKTMSPFLSSRNHRKRMEIQLQTIYRAGEVIYFGYKIKNRSDLPYTIDFSRLYMREKVRVKRSSTQQREIIPIYEDTLSYIPAKSDIQFVIALSQFTIPDRRQFILEIIEREGGRFLMMEMTNRQLFKAKEL